MALKAKFPQKCYECHIPFRVGIDWIESKYVGEKRVWFHVQCPENGHGALGSTAIKSSHSYSSKGHQYGVNEPLPIEYDIDTDKLSNIIDELGFETPREEVKSFIPSQYQQAIFDFIQHGTGNAVVEAVAGSGKTTTIVKALDLTPVDARVAFIAFNVHIVKELKKRSPSHVTVSTMHKLGLDNIKMHYPNVKVDDKGEKLDAILNEIYPVSRKAVEDGLITREQKKANYPKRASMRKLVSFCKSTLADFNDREEILALIDKYNIEVDSNSVDEVIGHLPDVIEKCKNNLDVIDFDDMPWLPVVLKLDCMKFDYMMVDEFQDMSLGNIEFLLMCLSENGRMICVGDRFQSLYAFRGAASDAMEIAIKRLDATVLPLSVTYRCPASHVRLAKQIVPQLEARENAPEGEISEIDYFDLISNLKPRDMVICRTNAPLIKPAFECVRRGMKAIIRSDIEKQLLDLIARFDTDNLSEFQVSLEEYFANEYQKRVDLGKEMQAELLKDRYDTINFVMDEGGKIFTVTDLKKKIKSIFGEDVDGIVFSSVHKAKGLEAERVFILRPDLMPHKRAKKDFELAQEYNAKYVAETRAKDTLTFVTGNYKGKDNIVVINSDEKNSRHNYTSMNWEEWNEKYPEKPRSYDGKFTHKNGDIDV